MYFNLRLSDVVCGSISTAAIISVLTTTFTLVTKQWLCNRMVQTLSP